MFYSILPQILSQFSAQFSATATELFAAMSNLQFLQSQRFSDAQDRVNLPTNARSFGLKLAR